MTKITKLTDEQKAKFPEYVDKWIKIGLSTQPADRERAERAIKGLYALANLKEPKVIWLPCPMSGALAAVVYATLINKKVSVGSAVDSAVRSAVDSAVRSAVGSAVRSAVDSAVRSAVDSAVGSAVYSAVRSAVYSAVDSAVRSAVDSAVDSAVRSAVDSAVDSAVYSAVYSAVDSAVRSAGRAFFGASLWASAGRAFFGASLWAGYPAWADYFNRELSISIDRNYLDMCESSGFYWTLDSVCFASERPKNISLDAGGRLHSETGQSISYPSGWGLWHWHGTQIPGEWVMGKPPTAKEALTWKNVEQRRAACEIVGWAKILAELNARVIDEDGDEEIGTLLEVNLPDSGKERFLQVKCGTGRVFALPVDRKCKTAAEANLWTYGLGNDRSYLPEVRT